MEMYSQHAKHAGTKGPPENILKIDAKILDISNILHYSKRSGIVHENFKNR